MGKLIPQQKEILEYALNILKPKPKLTGSEWADKYYYLSPESSSIPGKWKTRPWQKEILDVMTDQITPIVVFKKPTRVGYTKMIGAVSCFYIHQRPSVQLHYQPNDNEAKGYAEDEFEPMIRDNKEIAKLIETPNIRGRVKKEKTIKKLYPGGYAEILGAESSRNFNRRTARVVYGDEIDDWKAEAGGKAGDTITTMLRRTSDFWDRKNILGGKPVGNKYDPDKGLKLSSDISMCDYWYQKGTQEKRSLPCPSCNYYQFFEFHEMDWDKDKDKNGNTTKHYPKTAHFKCKKCGKKIFDKHKRDMDKNGKWVATNKTDGVVQIRSFHIWAMLSYSPNVTWAHIAQEFLDTKNDRLKLKAFNNEVLALNWEDDYQKVDIDEFYKKKENYLAEVPNGVLVLTVGVDNQDDRLELEIVGWGKYYESWSIDYIILQGDPKGQKVWEKLDRVLQKAYKHENGSEIKIMATCVDSGGHRTEHIHNYCKTRFDINIFSIKGDNAVETPILKTRASKVHKGTVTQFNLGVHSAKDVIHGYLTTNRVGAGYMHYPNKEIYNEEYFKQLTAEKRDKNGRWEKKRARNEAIDTRVYALGALKILENEYYPTSGFNWDEIEEEFENRTAEEIVITNTKETKKNTNLNNWRDEY